MCSLVKFLEKCNVEVTEITTKSDPPRHHDVTPAAGRGGQSVGLDDLPLLLGHQGESAKECLGYDETVGMMRFSSQHSWKGKYKRVLALGTACVATLNPSSGEATNQWPWSDVVSVSPVPGAANEFSVAFRKGKKTDTFRFSTEHRAEVVTHALRRHEEFADKTFGAGKVNMTAVL